jgi:hypothetical protein
MSQTDQQEQKKHIEMINEVAATVEIVDVKFTNFSARFDRTADLGQMAVSLKHRGSASIEGTEQPRIVVLADFVMEAYSDPNVVERPCIEIQAQLVLTYNSPKAAEFDSEHLDAFAQGNGIYNAWPYWREFVQSATARLGLPPFTVPSLKPKIIAHKRADVDDAAKASGKK